MIARTLLLVLLCSAAHCVPSTKLCTSTLSGQTDITPYCKSLNYNSEMSDSCTEAEVIGWSEHYYTLGDADMQKCLSVVLRVEQTANMPETYIYRGPLVGEIGQFVKSCTEYCSSLREAHKWLSDTYGTKVTVLYVSCMDGLNNEDLTRFASAGAAASEYTCGTNDSYAINNLGPTSPIQPTLPPVAATVAPIVEKRNGVGPGVYPWFIIWLVLELVGIVAMGGLLALSVLLFLGFKQEGNERSGHEMSNYK